MTLKTKYRFGFILTTAAGNMTRYQNLRKYADMDPEVECIWAPVKHYLEPDPFWCLPGPLRSRAVVMREAAPVMSQANRLAWLITGSASRMTTARLRSGPGSRRNGSGSK